MSSDSVENVLDGVVERIVFESSESGFIVGRLRMKNSTDLVTFVGNLMALSPGETVRLWGRWSDDQRFGRQWRVDRFQTILPTSIDGIKKYLGSGMIPGIGRKYAERIIDLFGVETLRVIDEEPERLLKVPGFGRKRAKQVREGWAAQKTVQSIMIFLQGHGIGPAMAQRIYRRYGNAAVAVVRDNPYRLATEIHGIGFRSADAVAMEVGISKDSPRRLEAGLLHTMQQSSLKGHVFSERAELFEEASRLLEVDAALLDAPLKTLSNDTHLVLDNDDQHVYLKALWDAETGAAELLSRLMRTRANDVPIKTEKAVEWVEKHNGIALSPEQRDAIRTAIHSKVMVITGGPGTGKTTVLNSLLTIFEKKDVRILLAAPTGRAAKRMESATGKPARTLHRLLEFSPKLGGFSRNEDNKLSADLIVLDECSMVDIELLHHFLKAVPVRARVVFVGDVDQLPSVGPGNVLMDLIASQAIPTVWLKTVFRQAEASGIVANAHRINSGQYPEFNDKDFFFVERKESAQALETVVELVANRIPKKWNLDPFRDIQVLAPMHRGDVGVSGLNEALQNALNPDGAPLPRQKFRKGDKVMQMRNNYDRDVYNGDVGVIAVVDEETREVEVAFEDRAAIYPFDELDELALAYASTVHKAQGSEYPAVVMPIVSQHYVMLQRSVLYTGITRARQLVVIVGEHRALRAAIANTRVTRRNARLAERLKERRME
ncbi:MAG TPA: ATP-dependent RecD-like DNA helicase [Candidatus Hydrogenedentes bacterium]|nr:ATP-dependent RecD-like DNA helicase [Candidatus Hydrogenedentota bacterium]HOS02789.1 ATP-dependent RecD-like DNA helicase [Candidatus Hydrogenedentota bacterium]